MTRALAVRMATAAMAAVCYLALFASPVVGETIEATAHIRRIDRKPDPRPRCTIQGTKIRKADHNSCSSTDRSRRR